MASEKAMNQSGFGNIAKELTAYAEIIRTRQDQKQVAIDDFVNECKRYKAGKIAKKSLVSSIPRVRKELQRLNDEIRKNIRNLNQTAEKVKRFGSRQTPKNFRVSLTGISSATIKKKHRAHKRTQKKVVHKKASHRRARKK